MKQLFNYIPALSAVVAGVVNNNNNNNVGCSGWEIIPCYCLIIYFDIFCYTKLFWFWSLSLKFVISYLIFELKLKTIFRIYNVKKTLKIQSKSKSNIKQLEEKIEIFKESVRC